MEIERRTYNLTRKLYSDARRLLDQVQPYHADFSWALVPMEDLDRLHKTLIELKNSKKED